MSEHTLPSWEDFINSDEIKNFTNSIKGFGEEMGVTLCLKLFFPEPKYMLLNNLLLPFENGVGI